MTAKHRTGLPAPIRGLLEKLDALQAMRQADGYEFTSTNMREGLDQMTRNFVSRLPEMPWIHDTLIPAPDPGGFAVPVRIYHPRPAAPLPVLVFAHGGGHMAGSVSTYEPIARKLAHAGDRVLVSVDYRLAPECPYPAGLNDLITVLLGVFSALARLGVAHLPRLAVAGDSGGGAITASAVHLIADRDEVCIEQQLLIYPSLDYTLSMPSIESNGHGLLLEAPRIRWLFDQYFQAAEDRRQASPLFMPIPDSMPDTLVVTASLDPLRDEGAAYVERLKSAGAMAAQVEFDPIIHAFLNLEDLAAESCERFYSVVSAFFNPGDQG